MQGITSAAAAELVQEAARPLEEQLAAVQQQQAGHAASSGEALGQLMERASAMEDAHNSLQGAVASFHQASSPCAGPVGASLLLPGSTSQNQLQQRAAGARLASPF